MTSPVNSATAPVKFEGHNVVDGKVQANKGYIWNDSARYVSQIQSRFDAKVAADAEEQRAAAAEAQKNAKTPVWKLVLGTVTGYYVVKFVLGTIASLLSKCFALFSKKSAEQPKV